MNNTWYMLVLLTIILSGTAAFCQQTGLFVPLNFQQAYQNQTRSMDGRPGPAYWQNRADYVIDVALDPYNGTISGRERITYFNHSPDTLSELIIHLFPNVFRKGNAREFSVNFADETDGVFIERIRVNDQKVDVSESSESIEYIHNDFKLTLPAPLYPQQKLRLNIAWRYPINQKTHMRTGRVDSTTYFIAYFFPRIAVYDDIDGWNDFKYSGHAEFYNDFGDFDVSITVPEDFIVWATGSLQNPQQVLTEKYQQRLQAARASDSIIHIIDSTDYPRKDITVNKEKNIWRFRAYNVPDFAFASSDHYLWDATSLVVDKKEGKTVLINTAYNKNSKSFYRVADISRNAIAYMSYEYPAVPFPYPTITVFNGSDEMEYPMMVNEMTVYDDSYLIKLTTHELLHSYLPFYSGINECKYAWMDEGWASFADYVICSALDAPENASIYYMQYYKSFAGRYAETPIFTDTRYLKRPLYHVNSYAKAAAFFLILQDLLGDQLFTQATQEFISRWKNKHPMPFDFFYTFNEVSGKNLNWLFKSWFFEYGYVDLAFGDVVEKGNEYIISIERRGHYPAPVNLNIVYSDGSVKSIHKKAAVWKDGNDVYRLTIPASKRIKMVELPDTMIPDADLTNNQLILNH